MSSLRVFVTLALVAAPIPVLAAAPPAASGVAAKTGLSPQAAIARAAPKYSCTITPASPPKGDEFQVTQYTLKLLSGSPVANQTIKVALGIQTNGQALPTACTSSLKNGSLTVGSVIMTPPIMDPNFIWLCNAVQTTAACETANPAVPR